MDDQTFPTSTISRPYKAQQLFRRAALIKDWNKDRLTSTVIQGTLNTCDGGLSPGTYLWRFENFMRFGSHLTDILSNVEALI